MRTLVVGRGGHKERRCGRPFPARAGRPSKRKGEVNREGEGRIQREAGKGVYGLGKGQLAKTRKTYPEEKKGKISR